MKKIAAFVFLLFHTLCFSENQPSTFQGYDKVKWKSSVEEVKKAYPEISLETAGYYEGVDVYCEKDPSEYIAQRDFYFFQNKLYKVTLLFKNNLRSDDVVLIAEKLVEKYGKAYDKQEINNPADGYTLKGFNIIWRIEDLKSNLTGIELKAIDQFNRYNQIVNNIFIILYYDTATEIKVMKQENEKKKNKIGI